MPKRKREDTDQDVYSIKNQAIRIKASRLKAKFEQGVTQLTQALRLARGFDRQKMTRRISQAGSDKSKLERLKAEVDVLNGLHENKVARKYLLKQCVRTKRIAEAEGFIALFGGPIKTMAILNKDGAVGVIEGNVLGRLMKSGPVNDVVPGVMKDIREVLGADRERPVNDGVVSVESNGTGVAQSSQDEDDFVGFSDAASDEQTHAHESRHVDVEDDTLEGPESDLLEAYGNRIAASSDESDSDEVGRNHDRLNDMDITTDDDLSDQVDMSLSGSNSEHDLPSQKPLKNPPPISGTSFLPSLMHGGYYSGSDTSSNADPGDLSYDPDKSFAAMTNIRKNRRGQQARQAIAEKKFGNKAKHLVKVNGAEGVHSARQGLINGDARKRDQGWDARKGAVGDRVRKSRDVKEKPSNRYERRHGVAKVKPTGGRVGVKSEAGRSTGANAMTMTGARPIAVEKKTATKEKLHPSWEAARKRKIESATIGASSFAGKKITFD